MSKGPSDVVPLDSDEFAVPKSHSEGKPHPKIPLSEVESSLQVDINFRNSNTSFVSKWHFPSYRVKITGSFQCL